MEVGASNAYLADETAAQLATMRARRALYTPARAPIDPAGRIVIVVDDGLATGATMMAALHSVRARHPARLVCAVPVASPDSLEKVRTHADEVVCLDAPDCLPRRGPVLPRLRAGGGPGSRRRAGREVTAMKAGNERLVRIPSGSVLLEGMLELPKDAQGVVLFAHGSGSSRHSPRNNFVAAKLREAGLGTLLIDLLTAEEDQDYERRFDIALLVERLHDSVRWLAAEPSTHGMPVGLFGASTGAAAALQLAAAVPSKVAAVVSRGGRPDLAGQMSLVRVKAPDAPRGGRRRYRGARAQRSGLRAASLPEVALHRPGRHAPLRGAGHAGSGGEPRRGVVHAAPRARAGVVIRLLFPI